MYIKYSEHLPELVIMKIWQLEEFEDIKGAIRIRI